MSKGSNRRPAVITKERFESNWDLTFGRHEPFSIWLDDSRDLPPQYAKEGNWVIARTPPEFFALIEDGLQWVEAISFDNDLGTGWAEGYELLCEIERMVIEEGQPCPRLFAHTQNPPARRKMNNCIAGLRAEIEQGFRVRRFKS